MLVIPWLTVQSVNLLLVSVELPIIRSLKRGVVDCESDSTKGKRESWSEWLMDHQGAVKANDELVCISIFSPPPFSSWHREGNALCFLKDVQFSSLHPSSNPPAQSSSHQIEDLEGLWQQLWLPAEASSPCRVATLWGQGGKPTNVQKKKERGYSRNAGRMSAIHFHMEHQSSLLL